MNTDHETEAVKAELLRIIRTLPPADLEILRDALRKAPPFDWDLFRAELAKNPDFDPFTKFSFHQISKHERGEIARLLVEERLKRKPAQEAAQ